MCGHEENYQKKSVSHNVFDRRSNSGSFLPKGRRRQKEGNGQAQLDGEIAPVVVKRGEVLPSPDKQAVYVQTSTIDGAGCGLFAASRFVRGDRITEYCGQLMNTDSAKKSRVQTHMCAVPGGGRLCIAGFRTPVIGKGGGSFANDCFAALHLYNAEKVGMPGVSARDQGH